MRVFISSTFKDLKDYREAAFRAVHSLGGHGDDMVYWSADEREGAELSVDRVKQCDVLILLLAHRYGYIPPGSEYGITEMEYRTAQQANIPVLAFLVDESIPWPPEHIEWEQRERLKRFRAKVESEVTRRAFRSPEELEAYVTQALALFKERHRKSQERQKRFTGRTILVDPAVKLQTVPDLVLQIGQSEDGIPLLLRVKRSRDLSQYMTALARVVTSPGEEAPHALLSSFHQALEQHAVASWARYRIQTVQMADGSAREMYVTQSNLSRLSSSLFARILRAKRSRDEREDIDAATALPAPSEVPATDQYVTAGGARPELQSAGGLNRFLGVSIPDGVAYSVGRKSGQWVEWRPFLFESIPENLPNAHLEISGADQKIVVDFNAYLPALQEFALESVREDGVVDASVSLIVPRESAGRLILRVAYALAEFHRAGRVHGDLKPKNVLLTRLGPVLIDDFGLESGDRAPGWTPNWSAPEQIMSEPTTPAADTYPLGVMVARLLGGIPVGEVRKFRTPPTPSGTDEHNVFFNPSVYIDRDEETDIVDGDIAKWLSFAKGCLRFDPIERPASASEFADSLQSLLEKHPLKGQLRVSILQSDLVAATLLDGSQSVSRLISDIQTDGDWELGAIPIPLDLYPKPPVPRELPHPGVT